MTHLLFSVLEVDEMPDNTLFALIKSSSDMAIPARGDIGDVAASALVHLVDANDEFGTQINKYQKKIFSEDLLMLDRGREATMTEINRWLTACKKEKDDLLNTAALSLRLFLTPYRNITALPLHTQTNLFGDMIAKYKMNSELVSCTRLLDIDKLFTLLELQNNEFGNIYQQRNMESAFMAASAGELRSNVICCYRQFCIAIEQAANLIPNPTLSTLFDKLDRLRKKHHGLIETGEIKAVQKDKGK